MFVDTHAHIYSEFYDDIDEIIRRSKNQGIMPIINNGCDNKSNKEVVNNLNDFIFGALGIHPESVDNYIDEDILFIEKNLNNPKIVAIGEIGLDYHYTKENKKKQIELFERQLKLAEQYNMPVIIHSRDATEDTINTLKKYKLKGVIHSFSGSLETAKLYLKMGFKLGINGVITFKNARIKEVYEKLSLDDFVIETDSPYLTPEPYRGYQNEPQYAYYTAQFVAKLFNISLEQLAEVTNRNARSIFDKLLIP